jgi:hypothetical protein
MISKWEEGFPSKKAVSPVVSIVIITVVCLTLAISSSFWLSGIIGSYTKYESIDVESASCIKNGTDWIVELTITNSGPKPATLMHAYINKFEVDVYNSSVVPDQWSTSMAQSQLLSSGETLLVSFYIDPDRTGSTLTSGTLVEVSIHSASGMDFPKMIILV